MVIMGGLPSSEMAGLNSAIKLSIAEQNLLTSWQDPPAWDPVSGQDAEPPGRGKFLIKVGTRIGIPLKVKLTSLEREVNDTNERWHEQSSIGDRAQAVTS